MNDLRITGARRWGDRRPVDVAIRGGRIVAVGADARAQDAAQVVDATGQFMLPGLVDGHAHLDKTLWGERWHPHQAGPSIAERIANERRLLRELGLSPQRQSARLLRHMVSRGTTHVRTHVDVGPETGLDALRGVLAMHEAHRDFIDLQVVAFPQTGVVCQPGTLDLLDAAVSEGAHAIGGIDPFTIDSDAEGQLDGIFAIAARRGCELDIHLHERGELGARAITMICDHTQALGLQGRVALGHAFCLGELAPQQLDPLVQRLARLGIAVMTHAPMGYMPFPPVRRLAQAGVRLFTSSDGVRDAWSPMNTGDLLERAYLIAYNSGFRDDPGLELALSMATHGGAGVMGATDYGLRVGCVADLVLVDAECAAEAVAAHPPRRLVLKRGRVVARDGQALLPPVP